MSEKNLCFWKTLRIPPPLSRTNVEEGAALGILLGSSRLSLLLLKWFLRASLPCGFQVECCLQTESLAVTWAHIRNSSEKIDCRDGFGVFHLEFGF